MMQIETTWNVVDVYFSSGIAIDAFQMIQTSTTAYHII